MPDIRTLIRIPLYLVVFALATGIGAVVGVAMVSFFGLPKGTFGK